MTENEQNTANENDKQQNKQDSCYKRNKDFENPSE